VNHCEKSRHLGVGTVTGWTAAAAHTQNHHRGFRNREPRLTPHAPDSGMSAGSLSTAFFHGVNKPFGKKPTLFQHTFNRFSPSS
jgi:hypothetical protein